MTTPQAPAAARQDVETRPALRGGVVALVAAAVLAVLPWRLAATTELPVVTVFVVAAVGLCFCLSVVSRRWSRAAWAVYAFATVWGVCVTFFLTGLLPDL
ncbi:hypothetical protein DNL40_11500 [Xylanimonas oleitrophica]|uniref:Uncharacterized protein n=1 Tax=Xylanimonas oleitrophica TaxID=2607479 RepID=A0A2W5WXJ3_9MICO|nr:hypothetical protein [Xylanimonas oleitrophica]PZR52505.1 hypothetical protein DNL40_11500 [Xylanimonas oleitrophica]